MFVSTRFLVSTYGIDDKIAKFFADRDPPADNLYWQDRLLYLLPAPGYLFIPLIADLFYKAGIDREALLSAEFINAVEQVCHISALEESGQITEQESIKKCAELVAGNCNNREWYESLTAFMLDGQENLFSRLSSPYKALRRGDIFLFSVCALDVEAAMFEQIASLWYALISGLLLVDDADDMREDKTTGDANAFLESGMTKESVSLLLETNRQMLQNIAAVNPVMACQLEDQLSGMLQRADIAKTLSEL